MGVGRAVAVGVDSVRGERRGKELHRPDRVQPRTGESPPVGPLSDRDGGGAIRAVERRAEDPRGDLAGVGICGAAGVPAVVAFDAADRGEKGPVESGAAAAGIPVGLSDSSRDVRCWISGDRCAAGREGEDGKQGEGEDPEPGEREGDDSDLCHVRLWPRSPPAGLSRGPGPEFVRGGGGHWWLRIGNHEGDRCAPDPLHVGEADEAG